jgi:hypothetical protein
MLDPTEFQSWHESFAPDSIIGEASDRNYCPLAQFLSEHGTLNAVVDVTTWHWNKKNESTTYFTLPIWAQNYRYLCDNDGDILITRDMSLDYLKRALEHTDRWGFPNLSLGNKPRFKSEPKLRKEISQISKPESEIEI